MPPSSTDTPPSPLPLSIPSHSSLTAAQIHAFPPFTSWLRTLQHSLSLQTSPTHPFHHAPYALTSINIQSSTHFGPRLGFLTLHATLSNPSGQTLPGVVFLRGGSVAILLILTERRSGEEWAVLTVQPRVAAGSLAFTELPAGMLDSHATFVGAAAKEIEEECGIVVEAEELLDLTQLALGGVGGEEELQAAVYPSPGGCDEAVRVFACRREVGEGELAEWKGRLTGLREEGEMITLKLVRMTELWRETRDAKALCAVALWEGLKREGRV